MLRFRLFLIAFLAFQSLSFSQSNFDNFLKPSDSLNVKRRTGVYLSEVAIGGLTLVGLNQLWYADYERSKFHTFNDNKEWLQLDKMGHAYTAYQMGRAGANLLAWSGASKNEQLLYGASLGFTFLTAVEIMDGFSKEWGFSWSDMVANGAGAGLYAGQEVLWNEQRVSLKYSFHQTKFAGAAPDKLGSGLLQEILKDYNGQTYWLSFNIYAFTHSETVPRWLNVAVGYGGDGMVFSEHSGAGTLENRINPLRQFYFSLDVDFTRIKTQSHLLRSIFDVLNVLKVPFPAVEFTDGKRIKLHGVYF